MEEKSHRVSKEILEENIVNQNISFGIEDVESLESEDEEKKGGGMINNQKQSA